MLKKMKYEISHNKHYYVIRYDNYTDTVKVTCTFHDEGLVEDSMMAIPVGALDLIARVLNDICQTDWHNKNVARNRVNATL